MLRKLVVDSYERPKKPSMNEAPQLSDRAWTVLQRCWQAEPSSRPTADAVHHVVSSPDFKVGSFNKMTEPFNKITELPSWSRSDDGDPLDWQRAKLPSWTRSDDDDLPGWQSPEAPNPEYDISALQSSDGKVLTLPDLPPIFRPLAVAHRHVNFTSQYPRGAKVGGTKNRPPSSLPVPFSGSYVSHAPPTSYSSSRAAGIQLGGVVSEDYSDYINIDLDGAPTDDM